MKIQKFNEKVAVRVVKDELNSANSQIKKLWYDLDSDLVRIQDKFTKYVYDDNLVIYDRNDETYLPTLVYIQRYTKQAPVLIFRDDRTGRDIKSNHIKEIKSLDDIYKNDPEEFMSIYEPYQYNEDYDIFFNKYKPLIDLHKDSKKYNL